MPKPLKAFLFWTPRILGILLILFLALLSLDVFEMGGGFWAILLGLVMHNIPMLLLLAALIAGWRWEWIGALAFGTFGIWYMLGMRGFDAAASILLGGIPILVGLLFLAGWIWRKKLRG